MESYFVGIAKRGEHKKIRTILRTKRVNVNSTDEEGVTALMCAAARGHESVVSILLEADASPDARHPVSGNTALIIAVQRRYTGIVRLLLDAGGDVDAKNFACETALFWAAKIKDFPTAHLLLEYGADIHAVAPDAWGGKQPLLWAATAPARAAPAMVRLLIKSGADLAHRDGEWERTALLEAIHHRDEGAAMVLLESGSDVNAADIDGSTCLHAAVENDFCPRFIKRLIGMGADVGARDSKGFTPLMMAVFGSETRCEHKRARVVTALAEAGACVSEDLNGVNLLHVCKGKEVTKALFAAGVEWDITDDKGMTPLMYAILDGDIEKVEFLVNISKKSGDPSYLNAPNWVGSTPLKLACLMYQKKSNQKSVYGQIIALLVSSGSRDWECIPSPCRSLRHAVYDVADHSSNEKINILLSKLDPDDKLLSQIILKVLHRKLPRRAPQLEQRILWLTLR